jgi:hypothetical protein
MAFITNQWLKGAPERSRYHFPVAVSLEPCLADDDWSNRNGVCAGIKATKSNGDYQNLYFQKADLPKLFPSLFEQADTAARIKIAMAALRKLDERSVMTVLSQYFRSRQDLASTEE